MINWDFLVGYSIITMAFLFIVIFVFRRIWTKQTFIRKFFLNLLPPVFSLLLLFIVLEFIFAVFVIQTDGSGLTLASRRWGHKYWNPINSYGYRDYEPIWGNQPLFVVGASFVAGHGIRNVSDRFSNLLGEKIEDDWTVTIVAKPGWSLVEKYDALVNHDKQPERIVVSYTIRDILSAAEAHGFRRTRLREPPHRYIDLFVNKSYFFNWVYWRVYKANLGRNLHWDYFEQAYNNEKIWETHEQYLSNLINYAKQKQADITFIVWPAFTNISESTDLNSKVVDFLNRENIKVLDLTKYFEGREKHDLIVNSMDPHPNERVHTEVAELLHEFLSPWK